MASALMKRLKPRARKPWNVSEGQTIPSPSLSTAGRRGSEDLPASGDGNPLTEGSVRVELRGFRNVRAGSVGNALWLGGGGPGSDEITFISVAHGYIVRGERNKRHYRM